MTTEPTSSSRSELLALEPLLHRLPPGSERAAIDALLHPEFFEVGASGSVHDRAFVIDLVVKRYAEGTDPDDASWSIDEFQVRTLAGDLHLVTYRLSMKGRWSRRSTLWRRGASGWQAVYHQGTPLDGQD